MAIVHCFVCDDTIDTDVDVEHFTDLHVDGFKRPTDQYPVTGYLCEYQALDGTLCVRGATTEYNTIEVADPGTGDCYKATTYRCDPHAITSEAFEATKLPLKVYKS